MSTPTVTQQPDVTQQPAAQPATLQPTPAPTTPSAQPQQGDQGLRQLREAYEGVKAKFEPFEKLNLTPDQIQGYSGVYQKVFSEAQAIGRELGYPDEEIAEALAEDPLRTIEFLRNQGQMAQEQRQQPGEQDLQELIEQQISQRMGPIEQRENQRLTESGNQLFEQTVRQSLVQSFKAQGFDIGQVHNDELQMLMTAASEIMKYDEFADDLKALKYEGKTAGVQRALQEAHNWLDKYYLARSGRERNRLQPGRMGQPAPVAPQGGRKPTLDEMIENPSLIDQAQGRDPSTGRYR